MSKTRKTSVERLVELLRKEGYEVPEAYEFKRLNPGHWGRSSGAWSWMITAMGFEVGSPDSVGTILKARGIIRAETNLSHGTIYANA